MATTSTWVRVQHGFPLVTSDMGWRFDRNETGSKFGDFYNLHYII